MNALLLHYNRSVLKSLQAAYPVWDAAQQHETQAFVANNQQLRFQRRSRACVLCA